MKLKSLLFGSAAALVAVTGAQAADMPMAEPVEYVRVCDAFGTGFFYIPGTDTCLKIGGYVRVEWYWQDRDNDEDEADPSPNLNYSYDFDTSSTDAGLAFPITWNNNSLDNFTSFARGALDVDARRMTDIGLLRVAFRYLVNVNAQFAASENNADGANLDFAFIQLSNDLGTLTIGHTLSNFAFKGSGTMEGTGANDANTTMVAYAINVGNGVSATIALEDSNSGGRNGGIAFDRRFPEDTDIIDAECDNNKDEFEIFAIFETGRVPEFCFADHDGDEIPDITGQIRLDQAWGTLIVLGALHHVRANAAAITLNGESNVEDSVDAITIEESDFWHDDDWGWAIGAGGEIVSGPFSAFLQGFYGEGVGNYFWSPTSGAAVPEAVWTEGADLDLTETWLVNGAVTAGLGSSLTAVIAGSYGEFSASGASVADYDEWAVAGDLIFTATSGFTVGVGVVHWDNSITDDGTKGRVRFQANF